MADDSAPVMMHGRVLDNGNSFFCQFIQLSVHIHYSHGPFKSLLYKIGGIAVSFGTSRQA
jgi:hypothetical protein